MQQAISKSLPMVAAKLLFVGIFFVAGVRTLLLLDPQERSLARIFARQRLQLPAGQTVVGLIESAFGKNELVVHQRDSILILTGWTVVTPRNNQMERLVILVDDRPVTEVTDFRFRPDVAEAFSRPDFERSGWRAIVPLHKLSLGKHVLQARAIGKNGATGELPAIPLEIR